MCCIDMKLVIQIVLYSVIGGLALNCGNTGSQTLSNCQNNPHIKIEKSQDTTSYNLSLISNGKTLQFSDWIKCNKSRCNICELVNSTDCGTMTLCEDELDLLLNSFCAGLSMTPTTPTIRTTTVVNQTITSNSSFTETVTNVVPTTVERLTIITTTIATIEMVAITPTLSTTTIVSTTIVTVSPTCTPRFNTDTIGKTQAPIIALGSLLGIFVVLLTAVIIGWMWTRWTIKRRGGMDTCSKNTTVVNERYLRNPTYEETVTSSSVNNEAPNSSAIIYDIIDKTEGNGPAYDVPNRETSIDDRQGQVVANLPGRDYSSLGLSDSDIENNYQQLDKENPGSKVKT